MKKKLLSLSILILNTISSANAVLPKELELFDAALVGIQAKATDLGHKANAAGKAGKQKADAEAEHKLHAAAAVAARQKLQAQMPPCGVRIPGLPAPQAVRAQQAVVKAASTKAAEAAAVAGKAAAVARKGGADVSVHVFDTQTQACYSHLMATVGYDPRAAYVDADLQRDLRRTRLRPETRDVLLGVFHALAEDEKGRLIPAYLQSRTLLGCLFHMAQRIGDQDVINEWDGALRPRLREIGQERAAQKNWLCGPGYLDRLMLGSLPVLRRAVVVCAQNDARPTPHDVPRVQRLRGMTQDAVDTATAILNSK